MNIPDKCKINNIVSKKDILQNANIRTKEAKIFNKHVKKIIWNYSLKTDNTGVSKYKDEIREYEEIQIIEIKLFERNKIKLISKIIQGAMPYPLILVFSHDGENKINIAHKENNKVDNTKSVVNELLYTDWIDSNNLESRDINFLKSIDIKNLSFSNFYKLYSNVVDKINIYNASVYREEISFNIMDGDEAKVITEQIERKEKEIEKLKINIKKEVYYKEQIKMNMKINKLKREKNKLIEKLK